MLLVQNSGHSFSNHLLIKIIQSIQGKFVCFFNVVIDKYILVNQNFVMLCHHVITPDSLFLFYINQDNENMKSFPGKSIAAFFSYVNMMFQYSSFKHEQTNSKVSIAIEVGNL